MKRGREKMRDVEEPYVGKEKTAAKELDASTIPHQSVSNVF